jgi:sulfur-carrier protein adenylyltransferase/sulfurtransferase
MTLAADEKIRYARHLVLPEVGRAGQEKLQRAQVLCVGAGGLGSSLLMYLAAAGIGRIGIVDFDTVDVSNLQRQIIHGTAEVGRLKVESARDAIHRLNPRVAVTVYPARLERKNALEILAPYDIAADGSDNFPTRYLLNDACVLLKKPYVYGSIFQFEGQASFFAPTLQGPCYRCLFPEPPPPGTVPSCAEGGVLGVLPGIIGCIQAAEIIKYLLGLGDLLLNRLLTFDARAMKFRELKLRPDPHCPLCGESRAQTQLIDYDAFCGARPATPTAEADEVSARQMHEALLNPTPLLQIIDIREDSEYASRHLAGVRHLPLSQLAARHQELDPQQTLYLHCQHGVRSLHALAMLREWGYPHVKSVRGGLAAYLDEFGNQPG